MSKKTERGRAERAAAALAEQRRRERRRSFLLIGGVVAAMVLIIGGGFLVQSLRDTSGEVGAVPANATNDYAVAIGQPSAPQKVVIYEDFLCPFCMELESRTRDDLTRLAEDGTAYVEFRPFNLLGTDYSIAAANAFAVVLDQSGADTAKKLHDLLYENQPSEQGPFPDADWLVQKAVEAGADEAAVREPIEDLAFKQWVVNATDAASRAGINSTPTVLVNGEKFSDGQTVDELAANLIAALESGS